MGGEGEREERRGNCYYSCLALKHACTCTSNDVIMQCTAGCNHIHAIAVLQKHSVSTAALTIHLQVERV